MWEGVDVLICVSVCFLAGNCQTIGTKNILAGILLIRKESQYKLYIYIKNSVQFVVEKVINFIFLRIDNLATTKP